MAGKFYAVKHGLQDNVIVGSWAECSALVKDVPGAKYKSFSFIEQARAYLSGEKLSWQERYNDDAIHIFTDGACSGNPGPGGWGAVIIVDGTRKELSGGHERTTNNRMEMSACCNALRYVRNLFSVTAKDIYLCTDSEYVYKALQNNYLASWKRNGWRKSDGSELKNVEIWKEIDELLSAYSKGQLHFEWTKGHAGHEENECCDKLARDKAKAFSLAPPKEEARPAAQENTKNEQPSKGITLRECLAKMNDKELNTFFSSEWLKHCLFFTEEGKQPGWLSTPLIELRKKEFGHLSNGVKKEWDYMFGIYIGKER